MSRQLDRVHEELRFIEAKYAEERAKRLRTAGEAALQKRLAAEVGAVRDVLIESGRECVGGNCSGAQQRRDGARQVEYGRFDAD